MSEQMQLLDQVAEIIRSAYQKEPTKEQAQFWHGMSAGCYAFASMEEASLKPTLPDLQETAAGDLTDLEEAERQLSEYKATRLTEDTFDNLTDMLGTYITEYAESPELPMGEEA